MVSAINKKIVKLGFDVIEKTNALLAYWDKDLICRFANKSYAEWFGVKPSDMINKMHIRELLGTLYQKNLPYIKQALKGKMQVFERDITTPSGETKHSIATYFPDIKNNKVKGFFVHVADVTYIKEKLKKEESAIQYNNLPESDDHKIALVEKELRKSLLTGFPGIKQLSKKYFISETKLKAKFKEIYDTTIFSYYRDLQMNLADHYLSEKKFSKKQIAVMLNFSNPSNFSDRYKSYLRQKEIKKTVSEIKQASYEQYKIFVQQAPYAIAMLDEDLRFIKVSEKWIKDFNLSENIAGLKFSELLPQVNFYWQELFYSCLKGEVSKGEDLFFVQPNNKGMWLKWDIRAWYTLEKKIGGVLIFTEDITDAKSQAEEHEKILEILDKTSEIARIGAWKRNFKTNTGFWSKITKEILEVPEDYHATLSAAINFYKEGKDRELVKKSIDNAIQFGKSFDIEAKLITAKGNTKLVRVIAYPIFRNGECEKLLGIFQDITDHN
ncbi:MAG TPA: PAS domain-containing protein [Parafilimonas sp.]|nr:PAS domain-containing protein [Parafilimonas sp.]